MGFIETYVRELTPEVKDVDLWIAYQFVNPAMIEHIRKGFVAGELPRPPVGRLGKLTLPGEDNLSVFKCIFAGLARFLLYALFSP